MRVLLVTTDYPPAVGGVQTYAFELANRLAVRCERFAVLTVNPANKKAPRKMGSFPEYRIGYSANLFPLRVCRRLAYLGRREGFDTVFCTSWPAAVGCFLARCIGGPATIYVAAHGRELVYNPLKKRPYLKYIYDRFRVWVLQHVVDGFFPVSTFTAQLLENSGVPSSRIRVLQNGTNPNQFYPDETPGIRELPGARKHKIILSVGRLVRRKGIDLVIRALPEVLELIPKALYVVVGRGPELSYLKELTRQLGVESSVLFVDREIPHELRSVYSACDVFVLPARDEGDDMEGFGIVLLEASACAKPVIGTTSGGIPDAILDGNTGILVPPDSPAELAAAIIELLQDRELARRLGANGRAHIESTANWDAVSERLFSTLVELSR